MRSLEILLAGVMAAAPIAANPAGFDSWKIDRAHSIARFDLASSSRTTQPYELAVAMVAGRLHLDPSNPAGSFASLTIYPAGQGSLLLTREGALRADPAGNLSSYSVLSFQSERAFITSSGKLAIAGDLTVLHVKRSMYIQWNDGYTGPVFGDPVEKRITGQVTFEFDVPASTHASGQEKGEISGSSVAVRAKLPGFWSSLRDSDWPPVILDKECHMPYFAAALKDYKGAICSGTPVVPAPHEVQQPTSPGVEAIGSVIPVGPTGDQVEIHLQLRMAQVGFGPWLRAEN